LGIESSCDDTGVAIVQYPCPSPSGVEPPSFLASQFHLHNPFGGVVPRYAARAHRAALPAGLAHLEGTDARWGAVDAVAVTAGPGLALCLKEGHAAATEVAERMARSLMPVHHVEAHVLSVRAMRPQEAPFPYLALVASGGHTSLIVARGARAFEVLGETLDDAAGEAWDKVARLCLVGRHGSGEGGGEDGGEQQGSWRTSVESVVVDGESGVGPRQAPETVARGEHFGAALERLAKEGDENAVPLPVPLRPRGGGKLPAAGLCDFSFSGLKGAARRWSERNDVGDRRNAANLAASFQKAACQHIADRVQHALHRLDSQGERVSCVAVVGGVAANQALRSAMQRVCDAAGTRLLCPPLALCTDNGTMVAWAAIEQLLALEEEDGGWVGRREGLFFPAGSNYSARWPIGTPLPQTPTK
jgi:N6-L-threonylcarbamoyladenine synthase